MKPTTLEKSWKKQMSVLRDASVQTEIVLRRRSVSTQTYFVKINEKISRQTQTEFPFELNLGTNITDGRNGVWIIFATNVKLQASTLERLNRWMRPFILWGFSLLPPYKSSFVSCLKNRNYLLFFMEQHTQSYSVLVP